MREQNPNYIILMIEHLVIYALLFAVAVFDFWREKLNRTKSTLLVVEGFDRLLAHSSVTNKPIGHLFIENELIDDKIEHDGLYNYLIKSHKAFFVNASLHRQLDSYSAISRIRAKAKTLNELVVLIVDHRN